MDALLPSRNRFFWLTTLVLLALMAWVYWPVIHAEFVWIDKTDFVDNAWLREGGAWKHYLLRDFNNWTQYFRPLVVALFTLQVRLFDASPGPMHAVSLVLHLCNVVMVGLLARRCCGAASRLAGWLTIAAMLLYGLHPLLVETVAWIGCQFELVINLLVLGCLLASTGIRQRWLRAVTVTVLFFLAACTKESAVVIPLLVLLFDWLLYSDRATQPLWSALRNVIRRNMPAYVGMLLAGIVYLFLRRWALGELVDSSRTGHPQLLLARLQEVAFLYMHYWGMLFSPTHMSVIHPVDIARFKVVSMGSMATDLAALVIFGVGAWLTVRRASVIGCIVLAVTLTLLPVLHIVSNSFDSSLYHERYAMTALAMLCVLATRMRPPVRMSAALIRRTGFLSAGVLIMWSLLAVLNIRTALPLWANDLSLWSWAAKEYPHSPLAVNNLLSTYINRGNYAQAHALAAKARREGMHCPHCVLSEATLALAQNDFDAAARSLQEVRSYPELGLNPQFFRSYLVLTGQMLVGKRKYHDAEGVLREAVKLGPMVAKPRLLLALALAGQGHFEDARRMEQTGVALIPFKQRLQRKHKMDAVILRMRK